jgi:hypothetical protein
MGLPLTRNRTYSDGMMVESQDLNDLQDDIVGVYTGTESVKSLTVDGVGGASVVAAPGEVSATGPGVFGGDLTSGGKLTLATAGLGTAIPSAVTPARYAIYRDISAFAAAFGVNGAASNTLLGNGSTFNISSIVRTGVGAYTFTFKTGTGGAIGIWPLFLPLGRVFLSGVNFTSSTVTAITTVDTAGAAVDANFSIVFYAP